MRREKDDYFGKAHDSPLTVEQRRAFTGLKYFDADPAFRFEVALDGGPGGVEEVEMSDGTTDHLQRAGTVKFTVDDTDAGWGELSAGNDERLLADRPPHWG